MVGKPYYVGWRLILAAADEWEFIDGWAAGHAVDLDRMPVHRFTHFMWWFLTRNAQDEAEVARLRAQVWQPPAGAVPEGPWAPEAEQGAFGSLKSALGV